ncbi:MAG: tetratricopeptide repeat protein [Nitrosomonadales bacterium]|nr:tetratricopeptide repeat protein [Nitrosomonadales bacterium]
MDRTVLFFAAALLLLLAGCASAPKQPTATSAMPADIPQAEMPVLSGGVIVEPEPGPAMSGNRAVIALLDRAQLDNAAGQREAAGASLERALRIEPRNAWLWHELAQLRLTQGQYAQAITLARKSNSFAGRERRVQAMNWKVIANARVAQGDSAGAEQAFKTATELEQAAQTGAMPAF